MKISRKSVLLVFGAIHSMRHLLTTNSIHSLVRISQEPGRVGCQDTCSEPILQHLWQLLWPNLTHCYSWIRKSAYPPSNSVLPWLFAWTVNCPFTKEERNVPIQDRETSERTLKQRMVYGGSYEEEVGYRDGMSKQMCERNILWQGCVPKSLVLKTFRENPDSLSQIDRLDPIIYLIT